MMKSAAARLSDRLEPHPRPAEVTPAVVRAEDVATEPAHQAQPTQQSHTLADGAQVLLSDSAVEVRDAAGMLMVRYENGHAQIAAPSGDLLLSAPRGNVVVQSEDALQVDCPRVELKAQHAHVAADHAELTAGRVATTASSHSLRAELMEVTAIKLIERTRDTFREASDLMQTRAGRLRALVKRSYTLFSGRTSMQSKDETSIDGSKILLG